MARGAPGVWSTVLGVPFVAVGGYVALDVTSFSATFGVPFALFGGFVIAVGWYVHLVGAPEGPTMREGETVIDTRHPTQRVALAKIVASVPFLLAAAYLLFATLVPYVYPTAALLVGLYLFSTGLYVYWTNSLTTYYVTTERLIKEYRFLSLVRQELPLQKVRGVEERKSLTEAIVGLGNVRVASGSGGGALEVVVHNVDRPTAFADEIRNLL